MALLLVTQQFLASDYISDRELKYFLEQSDRKNVVIFWVAVTPSSYEETALKDIQCVNDPAHPLSLLSSGEQDKVIVAICQKIKAVFSGNG